MLENMENEIEKFRIKCKLTFMKNYKVFPVMQTIQVRVALLILTIVQFPEIDCFPLAHKSWKSTKAPPQPTLAPETKNWRATIGILKCARHTLYLSCR
jgi:hypothetical protein